MRRGTVSGFMVVLLAACASSASPPVPVIPKPASVEKAEGEFLLAKDATLYAPDARSRRVAEYFADLMRRTADFSLKVADEGAAPAAAVRFALDEAGDSAGAYRLEVSAKEIVVSAGSPEGLFHGAVTLWQLAVPSSEDGARVAAMQIADRPGFAWRGVMLDSARHYQPPGFIKDFIDWMALHKLNVLHWHLTDDQAWRLEIKRYPELTEIGAWRVPAGEAERDIDPKTGKPRLYGGYYTQDEVRDIVAHASDRFVTIVPEIEMPGHAQAAIVAIPELGVAAAKPHAVSSDWGVFPYAYNVDEGTFEFLENVLAETAALFPGPYIHVGGDEVLKDQWREDARVQSRMRELGVQSEAALQGYFTKRIDSVLGGLGRRLVGWDEILEGGVSPEATVMSWRGVAGGVAAAKEGHDAVLAPAPDLYFDNRQSALSGEPPGRGRVVSLEDVYNFAPYPDELSGEERARIIGVQANIWTEHVRTPERVEHMAYPRLAALAEVAWAPAGKKDWPDFVARLAPMLDRYETLGLEYAKTAFQPVARVDDIAGVARVALENQARSGEIRFTLDGSPPTPASKRYEGEFEIIPPALLSAATFIGQNAVAASQTMIDGGNPLEKASQALKTCEDRLVLNLEDDAPLEGERAVFLIDIMNPCWIFEKADLSGVSEIVAAVGQIPFNFQIGDDIDKIALHPPKTSHGELEARIDGCDGPALASLPLAPAVENPGVTALRAKIEPVEGVHDLCLFFTGDKIDPMWAVAKVALQRRTPASP